MKTTPMQNNVHCKHRHCEGCKRIRTLLTTTVLFVDNSDKFHLIAFNFALSLLQSHLTLIHCPLLVAEEAAAGHTAVVAVHIAGAVAVGAADRTVAAAVHTDHTVTSPLVAAAVAAAAAAVVVGSSQAGSSFVLDCNYYCLLHLLSHLQSFP